MNFTIYKPNSKNTGSAFSFSVNKGKNDKTVLFVSMIQQYSWNDDRKTGSFKENAKNSEKSATTALSAIEAGEILSSFKSRIPFVAFHKKDQDTTIIKFAPWDKKRKIKEKDGDKWYETPAFGINITRNSTQTFRIPLEAGEVEALAQLLKEFINQSFQSSFGSKDSYNSSKSYKKDKPKEIEIDPEDEEVPF